MTPDQLLAALRALILTREVREIEAQEKGDRA